MVYKTGTFFWSLIHVFSIMSDIVNSSHPNTTVMNRISNPKSFISFLMDVLHHLSIRNNVCDEATLKDWINIPKINTNSTVKATTDIHVGGINDDDERGKNISLLDIVVDFASVHCIRDIIMEHGNEGVASARTGRANGSFYNDLLSSVCRFISVLPAKYFSYVVWLRILFLKNFNLLRPKEYFFYSLKKTQMRVIRTPNRNRKWALFLFTFAKNLTRSFLMEWNLAFEERKWNVEKQFYQLFIHLKAFI